MKETKKMTMTGLFAKYIFVFAAVMSVLLFSMYLFFQTGMLHGWILPANYMEKQLEHAREQIGSEEDISDWIPEGVEYAVFSDEGEYIKANTSYSSQMWKDVQDNVYKRDGYYYKWIKYQEETYIFRYTVSMRFKSNLWNRICPSPELLAGGIVFLSFLIGMLILWRSLSERVSEQFELVERAMHAVDARHLNFYVPPSNIKEIDGVLNAFEKMRDGLTKSLEEQWKLEEQQKFQTSALAHDIKTPLTVMKGNQELLAETELSDEQKEYNCASLKSIQELEEYLYTLLEVVKYDKKQRIQEKEVKMQPFLQGIKSDAEAMARLKHKQFEYCAQEVTENGWIDVVQMKRAVMNIISNALEYTPEKGIVRMTVQVDRKDIILRIEDSGPGFTKEDFKSAFVPFYQGDKSRSRRNHSGLGLYIASSIIQQHCGELTLGKSEELGGACVCCRVTMAPRCTKVYELPYE